MSNEPIILAPDSFKGSISSIQICNIMEQVIVNNFSSYTPESIPVSDGGEGFLNVLSENLNLKIITRKVIGPAGKKVEADLGIKRDTAYLEMAQSSGLDKLSDDEKNPLHTTTYGLGELIKYAISLGVGNFVLGIGGSATCEGGAGMAQALGAKFYDKKGDIIQKPMSNNLLGKCEDIDTELMDDLIANCDFKVASDVNNPLLGEEGAVYTYAPQKGARKQDLARLERNMERYNTLLEEQLDKNVQSIPGAGAAGGLGAGLAAFLNAEIRSGSKYILDMLNFKERSNNAKAIITGEGSLDRQTEQGKIVSEIINFASNNNIPVYIICGTTNISKMEKVGKIIPLTKYDNTKRTLKNPGRFIEKAIREIMEEIST